MPWGIMLLPIMEAYSNLICLDDAIGVSIAFSVYLMITFIVLLPRFTMLMPF